MYFEVDIIPFLVGLPIFAILFFLRKKIKAFPYFSYSYLKHFEKASGKKARFTRLPEVLYALALIFFFLAFIDPRIMKTEEEGVKPYIVEGRALYLVLDVSGSMKETIVQKKGSQLSLTTKIDLLKKVSRKFIEGRPQDLIGLVKFARTAHTLAPLTLDHAMLLDELSRLKAVVDPTRDGTAIGYAIYKTASILAATRDFGEKEKKEGLPAYDIKGAAIILVTDGFQFPNPADKGNRLRTMGIEEAAAFAHKLNEKLYIISIDPQISQKQFAPQRRLMTKAAETTGGKFFSGSNPKALAGIFESINKLEKSKVPVEAASKAIPIRLFSFAPYLILAGLAVIAGAILSETWFFRRAP